MAYSSKFTDSVLNKKKKQVEYESKYTKQVLSDTYVPYLDQINKSEIFNYNEIAPVKTETKSVSKKEEDKKWYQKIVDAGAFSDGYDFGDITKTVLGTATNVATDIIKAPTRIGEGLSDAVGYGSAALLDKFGKEEKADEIRKKANKNLTDEWFSGADKFTDKTSVLGETTDAILEGVGYVGSIVATSGLGSAAGLGAGGTTALTTGLTATSGFGSGTSEAYQMGATDEEAYKYGIISGAAESLSELLFGGLGKGARAVGLSKGIGGLDDILITKATKNIDNILARNLAQGTLKASGEGLEEVIAGTVQALGKKATYMSEEDLMQILEDEKLLEQFIIGGITSSLVQTKGVVDSTKQGRDFVTGYTNNEQTVINKEVESRIKEIEKDGTKLNNKEKSKIEEQVRNYLEKGYISTDRIESVLGGKEYNTYKSFLDKQNRYNELLDKNVGETTNREKAELDALAKELEQTDINALKSNLDNSIRQKISSDGLLQRSYQEKANKGVQYQADLTKYDAKQQKTIQKAIDSGILNNTNKTHEFIDMIAKISADKDIDFDFTNNENLKNSGFAVEGKTVNGFINENGITLNMDSNKALNKVVGHEIAHVLEGTELYTELQEMVKQYATTKGEYDTRLNALKELYKDIDNANVENELTADLIGDYLFTDTDFVNNLSTIKPNVFKKIYNEIKHLYNLATAGSKEARDLERVKKAFDKAYKENIESKETSDTKYSIGGLKAINSLPDSKFKQDALNDYKNALYLDNNNVDNERIRRETKWFKDKNGDWKFEFTDEYMELKDSVVLSKNSTYELGDILKHNYLFNLYPQLKNYKVVFKDKKKGVGGSYNEDTHTISVNNDNLVLANSKQIIEGVLIHEIQHAIQNIEGFEKGRSSKLSKLAYFKSLGEIEATDTRSRFDQKLTKDDRLNIAPESSKSNPKHKSLDKYLKNRNIIDKIKDNLYNLTNGGNANAGNNQEYNQKNQGEFDRLVDGREGRGYVNSESFFDEKNTNFSLSEESEQISSLRNDIFGRDIKLQEVIAPVKQTEEYQENVTSKETKPSTETIQERIEKENGKMTVKEQNAIKLNNYEKTVENLEKQKAESYEGFNELIKAKTKEYEGLKNKNTKKSNNLQQQIENLKLRRDNINVDYQRRIEYTKERIEKMNSKEFKTAEQRITKQDEYRELARELIGDTSTWQDKKLGIQYQTNTFRRNLRDVVRGADGKADIQTADAIYEEYQGKYNKNEAKLKVEYDNIIDPYRELNLTKEEHTYTQMLGELKYNPHTTLRQDIVDDYYNRNKSKIDKAKVNKTIEAARKTYDDLFNRINEVLKEQGMKEMEYRKGYFPHFTEDKQSLLAKIFDWKIHKTEIPTDIAGLTELYNPERSWQSFNKQRKGDITDYNFGKGLETYVKGALDWIYHIEDIQKRRALENEIRYQHSEKGVKDKIEKIYENTELDADEVQSQINAVLDNANNPLNNFVTDLRNSTNNLTGKKSSADRGMEYATNRRIYSTMTNISNRVSGNMVGGSISSALTNFIPITQSWAEVSPLSSLNATREVIKNAIQDDGTIAKSTFLTNRFRKTDNLYKTNWDKARNKVSIMTDIIDSITSQVVWRSKYNENIKKGMSEYAAIENADQFAENVIAGRSRGNQPTIFNSKNPITKMLTAFQLEVNNQYQYMFKDLPTDVGSESKAKLIKGYATMFLGAYAYNALYSSLTGRDAAFDPIGIVEDILKELGFGGDDEEEKTASEKFTAISEDLMQDIPFVGGLFGGGRVPISSAIPYENPVEMFTGTIADLLDMTEEDKREKSLKDLTSEWLKPVTYLALPFGGGQISKSIKGLSMYDKDLPVAGSYTNGGDLRFTADESLGGIAKSFLFGQYASKSAQEYVDSGFKTVKKSNIEELVDLGMTSTEYRKYRNRLKKAGTKNEDKLDYINSLDLPIRDKNIMANNVLDRDYDVDMSDYTNYEEFDFSYKSPEKYEWLNENNISYNEYATSKETKEVYNWAYNNPESYSLSKAVTDDLITYMEYKNAIYDIEADKKADGSSISGSRKNKIINYVNSLDLSIPQKAILIRKEYSTFNDYNYDIVEYVGGLDIPYEEKVTILKELEMTVQEDGTVKWK